MNLRSGQADHSGSAQAAHCMFPAVSDRSRRPCGAGGSDATGPSHLTGRCVLGYTENRDQFGSFHGAIVLDAFIPVK